MAKRNVSSSASTAPTIDCRVRPRVSVWGCTSPAASSKGMVGASGPRARAQAVAAPLRSCCRLVKQHDRPAWLPVLHQHGGHARRAALRLEVNLDRLGWCDAASQLIHDGPELLGQAL